jgi:hypothetical protein
MLDGSMTDRNGGCCGVSRGDVQASADGAQAQMLRAWTAPKIRWSHLDGGDFTMGTSGNEGFAGDGEGPARRVRLSPFSISVHAVTNRQFGVFVRDTGYATEAERFNWSYVFHALVPEELKSRVATVPAQTPWWLPITHAYWAQPEGPGSTVLDRRLVRHPAAHGGGMGVRCKRRAGECALSLGRRTRAWRDASLQYLAGTIPRGEHPGGWISRNGAGRCL